MSDGISLKEVPLGLVCRVEGAEELRLMELGFCRGSLVRPMYGCVRGGTRVYGVKGTMIALRDADAAQILTRVVE